MAGDPYLPAKMLAQLYPGDVHVNWLKFHPSLALTNKAFKIYYDAYRCGMSANGKLSSAMLNDLNSAAHEGCGFGVYSADLATVFETLWKNKKQWSEDYSENYCGPQITGANKVPVGVNNFLKAVDSRADILQKSYQSSVTYLKEAKAARSQNRWTEIGTQTENLKSVLESSEPYLWLVPKIEGGHDLLGKWTDGFGMLHSFLDNFNKINIDIRADKIPAALASAFIVFVSKAVPIFGDVYGKALETIPSLVKWAQNIRNERENTIRQISGPGYGG